MVETGKSATKIIEESGMKQISDDGALGEIVDKAIAANEQSVAAYRSGKQAALGAIVGWIMKETKGQANPKKINELLIAKLNG
jgi:aspartyl-tRNA(Asn)/glutamyl-tRNA(Gln) amidotransferase subunit B